MTATQTMDSVRWMLNKYRWMSATKDHKMPKSPKDRIFRAPLSMKEKSEIMRLHKEGFTNAQIARMSKRSHAAVITTIRGKRHKQVVIERQALLCDWLLKWSMANKFPPTAEQIELAKKQFHAQASIPVS